MNRREHIIGLASLAALGIPISRLAAQAPAVSIPPEGVGRRIRHLSHSDQGGRPDGVQVMVNRRHVYVGHMFNDGVTVLDATNPRQLKTAGFYTAGAGTRTNNLQIANDILLLANGANLTTSATYDLKRSYARNMADPQARKFRAGLSIHDVSRPDEIKEIAFLEIPGIGVNRTWWTGGRYAYVAAHFDGFTDHIMCIVDLQNITKPEIVSRWWLPGMNSQAGETPTLPAGRRMALHHMIVAGDRGYGAWRDGGFTIHDVADPAKPKLLSHVSWSPPFPGNTHTPLPLPGRNLVIVADEGNAEKCARGTFHTFILDVRVPENPVPIATLPTPADRDFCSAGVFGPHNLHENRPGTFQSEDTIFATYNNAGVRVFDIKDAFAPKEIASWVPPAPTRLVDPRPNVGLAARNADVHVTREGIMFVSDWNAGMHVLEYGG